jgi:dsRNA-specific ribonuclease
MELFKIAKKSKVPEYLNVIPFTKKLWRPLNLKSPAEPLEMDISDKQLADVFESILGMAYEQGGFSLANEALHNMYSSEFLVDWQDYLSKIHWSTVSMIMPEHWERIKRVQEIIGYDFKRPEILLEALTHPSVIHDIVPSYQRLEFLGRVSSLSDCG